MKNLFLTIIFVLTFFTLTEKLEAQSFQTGKIAVIAPSDPAGRIRIIKDSLAGVRQIDRSSFLAGVNPNYVFSYKLSANPEDSMRLVLNPSQSDFEIYGSLNNTYDTLLLQSPNFLVKTNIYGWTGGGYLLIKFTVINRETGSLNTFLGMELIPQVDGTYGLESIKYLLASQIISMYRVPTSAYTGYKILSQSITSLTSIDWYTGYNTVNPDMFGWLTHGTIDTLFDAGGDGAVTFFSQDAVNILPGDSTIIWVGISVGNNESEMVANMNLAEQKYNLLTLVEQATNLLPNNYSLEQNYPNPFNPETSIRFLIPQQEFVSLKVFNSLGQEIASPLNRELQAGTYNLKFYGEGLTSGVYFYTITAGNFTQTKKMILMR